MSRTQYMIVNEATGLVLDVNSSGDNVVMWSAHGGNNQRFTLDGPFIRAVHSGKVLDVSRQDGSILQWEAHGLENQRWEFHPDGTIRLEGSDLCMDVEGGNEEEGARVIAWPFHGGANQRFRLVETASQCEAPSPSLAATIVSQSQEFYIVNRASGLVLDVNSSGDNVVMWSAHGGNNQRFTLDGPFIRAVHSGKVLDVSRQDGSILQWEAHGLENQRWEFHPDGTIRLEGSDLCMDVEGGSSRLGASVIAWPFHGGANQVFDIIPVPSPRAMEWSIQGAAVAAAPVAPVHSSDEEFYIVNRASGLVLDVNSSGDNVVMWSAHGGNNQRFTLDGPFIRAVHSGKVLDVSRQDGSILQWEAHGLENQRWEFHPDGTIRLEGSDLCMDVEGGNEEEGARVIAWPFHGGANQVFEVRRVAHAAPVQPFVWSFHVPRSQYARIVDPCGIRF